jgi:hypothetical protein
MVTSNRKAQLLFVAGLGLGHGCWVRPLACHVQALSFNALLALDVGMHDGQDAAEALSDQGMLSSYPRHLFIGLFAGDGYLCGVFRAFLYGPSASYRALSDSQQNQYLAGCEVR